MGIFYIGVQFAQFSYRKKNIIHEYKDIRLYFYILSCIIYESTKK